ncbi:hypothetical protein Tco_0183539 [Tanacetum coccineum]
MESSDCLGAFDFTLDDVLDKAVDADGIIEPIKELTGTPPTSVSTKLEDVGKTMCKAEGILGLVFSFGMQNNHMELGLEGVGDDDDLTFHLRNMEPRADVFMPGTMSDLRTLVLVRFQLSTMKMLFVSLTTQQKMKIKLEILRTSVSALSNLGGMQLFRC